MESSIKSLQVLGVFALTYNFLMDASFSCNLRANLVKKEYEEMPETLDDMLRLNRMYFYPVRSQLRLCYTM